jgi:hypothetical protein
MARHTFTTSTPTEAAKSTVTHEGFISLSECQTRIGQLNKRQRQLSKDTKINSVSQLSQLTPVELARLAYLIAGRQNRRVS